MNFTLSYINFTETDIKYTGVVCLPYIYWKCLLNMTWPALLIQSRQFNTGFFNVTLSSFLYFLFYKKCPFTNLCFCSVIQNTSTVKAYEWKIAYRIYKSDENFRTFHSRWPKIECALIHIPCSIVENGATVKCYFKINLMGQRNPAQYISFKFTTRIFWCASI